MDTQHAEALGVHPLDSEFARIDQVQSPRDALDVAFALMPLNINVFFDVDVSQDEKNSSAMAIHLSQGGLGLPDRDFYFNPERGVVRSREEYVAHIARTLQLLGRSPEQAQAQAREVLKFETALAKSSRKLEELNDPDKNYHPLTPAFLTEKYTPSIDWKARLAAWNLHPDVVIVGQPEFFAALEKLLHHTPVPVLRDYMRVHLLDAYATTLSKAFDDEHFRFYGQVLAGQKEQRERWKRVLDAEDEAMGFMLGKIFVHEYFPRGHQETLRRSGRGDPRRLPRAHRRAAVDERGNQGEGAAQTGGDHRQGGLSGQVEGLLDARNRPRFVLREHEECRTLAL